MGNTARGVNAPESVVEAIKGAAASGALPCYLYDLDELECHVRNVRSSLPAQIELFYAVKANPDPALLSTLAPLVDGFDVASAGELRHVRKHLPEARLGLGGPGKSLAELTLALELGVERIHIESPHTLRLLATAAHKTGRTAEVLLRANVASRTIEKLPDAQLRMGGIASPFGMDPAGLAESALLLKSDPRLRLRGVHAHLASGLAADDMQEMARAVLTFAHEWCAQHGIAEPEVNLGGGMGVDYSQPAQRFDWGRYGAALVELQRELPGAPAKLRVEPGRSLTAYCGWYAAEVLELKRSYGRVFAIVHGGTHHLRTPAAKSHSQPFFVVPTEQWSHPWPRPALPAALDEARVTVVGELCTPKDVLATDVYAPGLRPGDVIVFAMAGAYAWNISHRDFLMHDQPRFRYLPGLGIDLDHTTRDSAG